MLRIENLARARAWTLSRLPRDLKSHSLVVRPFWHSRLLKLRDRSYTPFILMRVHLVGLVAVVFAQSGCHLSLDWKNHVSLRSTGTGLALAQFDPREDARAVVRANLDYASIGIDSLSRILARVSPMLGSFGDR